MPFTGFSKLARGKADDKPPGKKSGAKAKAAVKGKFVPFGKKK